MKPLGTLVVVGCRMQAYREYALTSLAREYSVVLLSGEPVTWQQPYLASSRVVETTDPEALLPVVTDLVEAGATGILTWDEWSLAATAQVAWALRLPHLSPSAARLCRDKSAMRAALAKAGVSTVAHRLVGTAAEARAAAEEIGFPVVLKPRSLGGSLGVQVVRDAAAVSAAFAVASTAGVPGLDTGDGVLLEEYLTGPEISVDSVVAEGRTSCVVLARKRLGFDPHCEEVGHLVVPWRSEPRAAEIVQLVEAVHRVAGVESGATHAEFRLTPRGPRLVELNGRLGGDLIPYLGALATGVDLPLAAAAVACGRRPDVTPRWSRYAEIRFLYPPHDGTVAALELEGAATVPSITEVIPLARPGDRLRLPPGDLTPRVAAVVAVADGEPACQQALNRAVERIRVVMRHGAGPDQGRTPQGTAE
jgi:biotin carboxylase